MGKPDQPRASADRPEGLGKSVPVRVCRRCISLERRLRERTVEDNRIIHGMGQELSEANQVIQQLVHRLWGVDAPHAGNWEEILKKLKQEAW